MFSKRCYSFILCLFLFSLLFTFCTCQHTTKPDKNEQDEPDEETVLPIANAGPDQITQVGSYAIFDASASTPGTGGKITWYEWKNHPSNPDFIAKYL